MGDETERSATQLATWLEIAALALAAIVPILAHVGFFVGEGMPRYSVTSDFALIEHDARHVWRGETLLGLGSRFGWHHPGPLFFYFVSPFVALFGSPSTGLYAGTWVLSAASAVTPVVATRVACGRAPAIAVLAGVVAWLAAFGNVSANPWNRTVIVLPLLAYVVLVALVARSSSGASIPAAFFGALVLETHVSTVTTVGALGFAALVVFFVRARYRGGVTARERRHLLIAGALLAVFVAPMLVEQLAAPRGAGNIAKLVAFLRHRQEPLKPFGVAARDWAIAASWLPDRILECRIRDEGGVPLVVRWDAVPDHLSQTARSIATIHVLSVVGACTFAWRRRDVTSLALLGAGVLGSAFAIVAMRAIAGDEHYSLLFWATAPSTVAWIGVASTITSAFGATAQRSEGPRERIAAAALVAAALALLLATASVQRAWVARNPYAFAHPPGTRAHLRAILAGVRERLAREDATPVIHNAGAWHVATVAVLELEKDGMDVRVSDADAWAYAGGRTAAGLERPLHLWFDSPEDPLPLAPCLELVLQSGSISVYGARTEPTACGRPSGQL